MIDTHCHLYDEAFADDRAAAVWRAIEAGVDLMLLPGIDSQSHAAQEALAAEYPEHFRQMMGLHPTSVTADFEPELAIVEQKLFSTLNSQLQNDSSQFSILNSQIQPAPAQILNSQFSILKSQFQYVGVGEIGLDLYWDKTFLEEQKEVLLRQMRWARQLDLPVCLHVRKAYNELFGLLRDLNFGSYKGVMHCFGGSVQEAHKAVEMGFHLGIGGVVTFKNATMADVVADVPLECLLLETDAPYLAPVPYRGKRNESAYIPIIAEKIAQIKGITLAEVAEVTTASATQLFRL